MDLGSRPRSPDEYFQRIGAVLALPAMGHIPFIGLCGLLQKGNDMFAQEELILRQSAQERTGFL